MVKVDMTMITIYNMPIWLRKFTFKEINDFYEEKAAAQKNEMSAGKTSSS